MSQYIRDMKADSLLPIRKKLLERALVKKR